MKLTLEEARLLLGQGTHTCPVNGALDRILAHDGSFDPRGENIHFLLRHYSEQNHVLYGGLHDYRQVNSYPYHPSPVSECCVLCAARITSLPYFTALNGGTRRWEVCRDCHAAVHGLAPSFSTLSYVLLCRLHLPRWWSSLCRFLSLCRRLWRSSGSK